MELTAKNAAKILDRSEYGEEGDRELFARMKTAKLVAVFGASDDLMELRGAIYDEVGCYDGGTAYLDGNGLLVNDCDNDDCPAFGRRKAHATKIKAIWCPPEGGSWAYKTDIPHETFTVLEEGELYCTGIVFSLSDVR